MSDERKSIGLDVAWSDEPAAETSAQPRRKLDELAADPVAFVEALPAIKRGAARRAINLDAPDDLGEWFTRWCRQSDVSQRDVFRALLTALRADVEQPAPPAGG
jgi:soluble lytic murein transglycosylase-like protein